MPNAVVVAGIGVKGISVAAVTAVAEATFGVVVDCVTLVAGLAVCGFLAVVVAVLFCDFLTVLLADFVVAVLVVVVFLVTALVAVAVLAVVSETVLVAANA